MLTKQLSTAERIQPRFIEPMYAEAVRELPDGGAWIYEARSLPGGHHKYCETS